ncbi:MAG: carbonic anhydrase [Opitutae bacterium]|nr:carbonic anhydrase [Opitutae bacterium]
MKTHLLRLLCVVGLLAVSTAHASSPAAAISPAAALAKLTEGNQRFVAGTATHPGQTGTRRTEVAAGQHPFAVILTCADSRLSPEIIFDQGLGDLFVVRNAGNLLDDLMLGSIEYAVEHLHAPLVVVLGHTKCGAVSAAVAGGEAPGHIKHIVEALTSAVSMAKKKPGDPVDNAVRINAKLSAASLAQAGSIIGDAAKAGHVKVVAARYDIATGQVEFLP